MIKIKRQVKNVFPDNSLNILSRHHSYQFLTFLLSVGSMFASLATVEVISSLTASVSENSIYSATVSFMNGFVFLAMAGFNLVDFILLV